MKSYNVWRYEVEYLPLPMHTDRIVDNEYGTIITTSTEAATVCKEIYDGLGEGYKIVELDLRYKNPIMRL
jgi:hypothetical protein